MANQDDAHGEKLITRSCLLKKTLKFSRAAYNEDPPHFMKKFKKLVFLQPKAGTLYILMLFKLIFFLFCKTPQSIQITSITYPLLLNSSASSLVNHVLLRSSGYLVHIINIFFIFPKFYSVFYSSYTMYI